MPTPSPPVPRARVAAREDPDLNTPTLRHWTLDARMAGGNVGFPPRATAMTLITRLSPSLRHEVLRDGLLDTVTLLKQHRAAEIVDGYIDDYVSLNWLEWNGGSLRLTVTGDNICKQLRARP